MALTRARRLLVTGGAKGVDQFYSPARNSASQVARPTASIRVGLRHRRDLGDIDQLTASIADVGLLHPVVIAPDGKLIAGQRRLAACKRLGWHKVPVTSIDLGKVVRGEYAENQFRKNLTPEEKADIADAVEPVERAAAKQRQETARHRSKNGAAKLAGPKGNALDKVGKAVGMSRDSIAKARAVRDAARAEPEKYGKLLKDMNRTDRVDGPFKRLKVMRQSDAIRKEPPPLPKKGPYRVIVADPPWPYAVNGKTPSHLGARPYPMMTLAQIRAFGSQVQNILHDDCIVWFWTTNYHMRFAFDVLDVWGLEPRTILTWVKDRMGLGDWLRSQTEHCIMAIRGKPTVTLTNQTTVLHAPMRAHSEKPVEFYSFVEKLCPASRYADIFSRYRHNDKWDCHGDEAPPAMEAAQ
jgi:N6-adenosine-specific RNA methylase IME4